MRSSGIVALCALAALSGCRSEGTRAVAERIQSRSQLIGGPAALGDVGDLQLSNGKVRFVVQGITPQSNYSRGWGVYGGALLDADLVRGGAAAGVPQGEDRFGELFPAFFLEAVEPLSVEVGNDGSNGAPATVVVKGAASPFLSLASTLLDLSVDADGAELVTTYSLGPNDQWLTITSTIVSERNRRFPASTLPGNLDLAIPFGFVLLFGNQNEVFLPGAGFDLRYGLEDSYKQPSRLPALQGIVTDLIATRGENVSYGVAIKAPQVPEWSYVYRNRDVIPNAKPTDFLVPFYASSFTGIFTAQPPDNLQRGEVFSHTAYFFVGDGDVGSVRDLQLQVQNVSDLGRIAATVREEETNALVPDASLVVLDAEGRPFSQYDPDENGRITGRLPAGEYKAVVVADNRALSERVSFTVRRGFTTEITNVVRATGETERTLTMPRTSRLNVRVTDQNGRPLPAKVTILGEAPSSARNAGREPREFLFDLKLGQRKLATDGLRDEEDVFDQQGRVLQDKGATRRYVERVLLAGADGRASGEVRPGRYAVIVSRGPEYEAKRIELSDGEARLLMEPGRSYDLSASLARVVDTTGWISADFHVHTEQSIDGHISLDERVLSYAAEGVEYVVATDHNFVTYLSPHAQKLQLQDWLSTMVGVEMTTLEMGHFNAFPVRYDPASITHGAFDWMNLPPRDLFQTLRSLAPAHAPDNVVQVNHPRDTILGYFNQFNVSADTGLPRPGNPLASPNGEAFGVEKFSWNFDAMEVFNGKRHELLRTFRMPQTLPPQPRPDLPIGPGEIVRAPCPETSPDCDYDEQEVSFPGAIDDWFRLLNLGGTQSPTSAEETIRPVTGTGNSDSHGLYFEEAGTPRNWLFVNQDDPRKVTDADVTRAVHRHQVMFSNGPFIEVTADGSGQGQTRTSPVGGLLAPAGNSVRLSIKVSAAPWIAVDRVIVYVNGEEFRRIPVERQTNRVVQCCDQPVEIPVSRDAWVVVAAEGDQSLFPYVTPLEEPPLSISDAVGAVAGPLGFGDDGMGNLRPSLVHPVTPFAMTNPIWIDRSGANGSGPADGSSFGRGRDVVVESGESPMVGPHDRIEKRAAPPKPEIPAHRRAKKSSDLRQLFKAWGHGHAH